MGCPSPAKRFTRAVKSVGEVNSIFPSGVVRRKMMFETPFERTTVRTTTSVVLCAASTITGGSLGNFSFGLLRTTRTVNGDDDVFRSWRRISAFVLPSVNLFLLGRLTAEVTSCCDARRPEMYGLLALTVVAEIVEM